MATKVDNIIGRVIKYQPGEGGTDLQFVASIFIDKQRGEYEHIYIVSDEEIQSGDRYIIEGDEKIYTCHNQKWNDSYGWPDGKKSKIIRTTHPDLGIDLIDQGEVQWYIDFLKNA